MSVMSDDFVDVMNETLHVFVIGQDAHGDETVLSNFTLPCYIEGMTKLVRDQQGQEVVSSIQVYVDPNDLTTESHRYTIPSRFIPSSMLRAISIEKPVDEQASSPPHHEVVMFP